MENKESSSKNKTKVEIEKERRHLRMAQALRDNLRKRKAQKRAQEDVSDQ